MPFHPIAPPIPQKVLETYWLRYVLSPGLVAVLVYVSILKVDDPGTHQEASATQTCESSRRQVCRVCVTLEFWSIFSVRGFASTMIQFILSDP